MKSMKKAMAVLLAVCMLASMSSVFAAGVDGAVTVEIYGTQSYSEAYAVLELVNEYRAENDLPALVMDKDLLDTAMQRAAECALYSSHTRPDGTDCFTALPSKCYDSICGENIAAGYESAQEVMDGWIASEGHRDNILDPDFKSIGIGCFYQDGYLFWTQDFSSIESDAPAEQEPDSDVVATVDVLPENLQLGVVTVEFGDTPEDYVYGFVMINLNIEFEYEYLVLGGNITYESSNEEAITVESSGIIEYIGTGTTTITCKIDGVTVAEFEIDADDLLILAGDANSDGDVTDADLVTMAQYLIGMDPDIDLLASDIDQDGEVTNVDLVALARYLISMGIE